MYIPYEFTCSSARAHCSWSLNKSSVLHLCSLSPEQTYARPEKAQNTWACWLRNANVWNKLSVLSVDQNPVPNPESQSLNDSPVWYWFEPDLFPPLVLPVCSTGWRRWHRSGEERASIQRKAAMAGTDELYMGSWWGQIDRKGPSAPLPSLGPATFLSSFSRRCYFRVPIHFPLSK